MKLLNCGYREVLKGCVSQWWRPITNYMLCYLKVRGCRWVRTQPGHVLNGDFDADPVARERGWWEATSERTLGLTSVSAPVRLEGRTVAAVCAAGPLNRMPTSAGQTWGSAVLEAAAEIEHALV